MRKATGFGAVLAMGFLGVAACSGGSVADDASKTGTAGFQLTTCVSDADCGDGSACLPEQCDATCVPDANGRCQPCPAQAGGICMPTASGGTVPAAPDCFASRLGDPAACELGADWGRQAVDACAAKGAELIDLHALLTCPDGRPSGVVFTCCAYAGTTPIDPPVPSECVQMPVRFDPNSPDPMSGDPKMAAYEQCLSMGMDLRDLQPIDPGPDGTPMTWLATCCIGAVTPPPPDPNVCTEIPVKADPANPDPMFADPKMAAYEQCRAMGLELRDIKPGEADASGAVYVWFASCCGTTVTPPEPPIPEKCFDIPMPLDCAADWDWKTTIYQHCQAAGGDLRDIRAVFDCPNGGMSQAVGICCVGATEPPVPPTPDPATCTEIPVGDGTCDATQDLKGVAWQKCLDMGATLTDVKVRNTCADGTIGAIIAACCP
jgi:hypothetical protein